MDAIRTRARMRNTAVDARQDDILHTRLSGAFEVILDRGCFHTLAPGHRHVYAAAVYALLAPDGVLLLKCFSYKQPGDQGPYRLRPSDINRTFGALFSLESISATIFHGTIIPPPKALFCILRKV